MVFQCEEVTGDRICEQPCPVRHCDVAQSFVRRSFREAWKEGRVVGPLQHADGNWLAIGEGFDPWCPTPERKSVSPAVTHIVNDDR